MKKVRVGTRGSKLALVQAETVIRLLAERFRDISFEIVVIHSKGDLITDRPLQEIGGSGLFTGELEAALSNGEVDFAVHSMKDLPSEIPSWLTLAPAPVRADMRDALILREGYPCLAELPVGAKIGTGSIRRGMLLKAMNPEIEIVPIRGNVDSRLAKVGPQLDGVVLAAAGLARLGLTDRVTQYFEPSEIIPAPCQGILALELRKDDTFIMNMLETIKDEETDISARAERAFLRGTGAGCHAPVGAFCEHDASGITLTGLYGTEEKGLVRGSLSGEKVNAESVGLRLAEQLLQKLEEM
ncbi:MAG: hydroxymethylbilane synthase [Firmicutes bacterium HGW-Firmicutes-16]|nr:MAG: hydroxymethylbilane synthase [Firmicutes bacterium HGW-Firmicutes-16]